MGARRTHVCVPILIALLCLGCLAVSLAASESEQSQHDPVDDPMTSLAFALDPPN